MPDLASILYLSAWSVGCWYFVRRFARSAFGECRSADLTPGELSAVLGPLFKVEVVDPKREAVAALLWTLEEIAYKRMASEDEVEGWFKDWPEEVPL